MQMSHCLKEEEEDESLGGGGGGGGEGAFTFFPALPLREGSFSELCLRAVARSSSQEAIICVLLSSITASLVFTMRRGEFVLNELLLLDLE